MSGFLKKPIGGKKSGKKKKKKEDGEEGKGMGSDGEERRSETPTPEQGEEEGAGEALETCIIQIKDYCDKSI